jgi:molybdopterin molybdotransferase
MMEISVEEGRALLASLVHPVEERESIPLAAALGRVLTADLVAEIDVPPHDNSAMDGYALASTSPSPVRVSGIAHAGKPFLGTVGPGECVRILTGAMVPVGADAVVMQERARRDGDVVHLDAPLAPGQNIRRAGEDLARGSVVLRAGRVLRAAELGAAASLGLGSLSVWRRPRIGFFTTGDELRPPGTALAPGQLYDSNGPLLGALIASAGFDAVDLGHAPDENARIKDLVTNGARSLDAIVSTGGVAVGDADCVQPALARWGVRSVEIAMKPGRHLAVGAIDRCAFFGLPGNPVAALVTFDQLVLPALRALAGIAATPRVVVRARTTKALRNMQARVDFQRGIVARETDGSLVVRSTGHQGAGILRSVLEANCFIVLPPSAGEIPLGVHVDVELFE